MKKRLKKIRSKKILGSPIYTSKVINSIYLEKTTNGDSKFYEMQMVEDPRREFPYFIKAYYGKIGSTGARRILKSSKIKTRVERTWEKKKQDKIILQGYILTEKPTQKVQVPKKPKQKLKAIEKVKTPRVRKSKIKKILEPKGFMPKINVSRFFDE